VNLHEGDIADALPQLDGRVDVVVANPPYIPVAEYESVDVEARTHDPAIALWAGSDGLEMIRVVEGVAHRLLRRGGGVGCEHADAQAETAPAVLAASGHWREVRDHTDLLGRPRYVTAVKA
jgi:release factor glutamine methyltransferase